MAKIIKFILVLDGKFKLMPFKYSKITLCTLVKLSTIRVALFLVLFSQRLAYSSYQFIKIVFL